MLYRFAIALAVASILALGAVACSDSEGDPDRPTVSVAEPTRTPGTNPTPDSEPVGSIRSQAGEQPSADTGESVFFRSLVKAAQTEAQAALDAAIASAELTGRGAVPAAALRDPVALSLARVETTLSGYADQLERINAPARFNAERNARAAELRRAVRVFGMMRAAAEAGDGDQYVILRNEASGVFAALLYELSDEYAEIAFVAPTGFTLPPSSPR